MSVNNELVLRGDDAARAKRIDLVSPNDLFGVNPTGPWAADLDEAYQKAYGEGQAEGRAQGFQEGLRNAEAETRASTDAYAVSLEALLAKLDERMTLAAEELAEHTTALALEIAEAILGRELSTTTNPGVEALARCMRVAPETGDIIAHLHPDDAALLGESSQIQGRTLTVIPDPLLERGDAVVKVDETMLDGRILKALERVAEVLL